MKVPPGEPIVIEGIHGLNDRLTWRIPMNSKFKIYISALTQLNLDLQQSHPHHRQPAYPPDYQGCPDPRIFGLEHYPALAFGASRGRKEYISLSGKCRCYV